MNEIKEMRAHTGMSQRAFADAFGIPVRTLQQWEQGISKPAPYVVAMLTREVERRERSSDDPRHTIPPKTRWKVCIDQPFENCEKVYPIQQRKVRELVDDIASHGGINEVRVFGSSVTSQCHMGSDVDIYVDAADETGLIANPHDFEYDLWTSSSADERLKKEIMAKGVKVYG